VDCLGLGERTLLRERPGHGTVAPRQPRIVGTESRRVGLQRIPVERLGLGVLAQVVIDAAEHHEQPRPDLRLLLEFPADAIRTACEDLGRGEFLRPPAVRVGHLEEIDEKVRRLPRGQRLSLRSSFLAARLDESQRETDRENDQPGHESDQGETPTPSAGCVAMALESAQNRRCRGSSLRRRIRHGIDQPA
jgi:hypothetical protein